MALSISPVLSSPAFFRHDGSTDTAGIHPIAVYSAICSAIVQIVSPPRLLAHQTHGSIPTRLEIQPR